MSIHKERLLYEDEHLLAVNKLSGELVVKGAGEVGKLPLLDFLKKDYPGLQTLHRLDFETSGVTVFAKNKKVASIIKESKFENWKKMYRTIVVGRPRERGEIRILLPARNKHKCHGERVMVSVVEPRTMTPVSHFDYAQCDTGVSCRRAQCDTTMVSAITTYKVLKTIGDISYVECEIETGRHHQIRRHFAGIGHPLVLDEVYGDRKFNQRFTRGTGYRKFFLHAYSIEFPHPVTGERMCIEAPLPRAFEELVS